jgi:hypothetical protein
MAPGSMSAAAGTQKDLATSPAIEHLLVGGLHRGDRQCRIIGMGRPASEDAEPQQESIAERQASERDETNSRHEAEIKAMDKRHQDEMAEEDRFGTGAVSRAHTRKEFFSVDKGIVQSTPLNTPDFNSFGTDRPSRFQGLLRGGGTQGT